MIRALAPLLLLLAGPLAAETVIAGRMIPAGTVIGPEDLMMSAREAPGALETLAQAIGLEARVVLYPGRPVRASDLGAPALIRRNQVVTLLYQRGGLLIATEARALGRAGAGDMLKVMNLASRSTVTGQVDGRGRVIVGPSARMLEDLEDFR